MGEAAPKDGPIRARRGSDWAPGSGAAVRIHAVRSRGPATGIGGKKASTPDGRGLVVCERERAPMGWVAAGQVRLADSIQ
jgi:hypothetical protein